MDFDSVTFEDLFQFSPEPSQTSEGDESQAKNQRNREHRYTQGNTSTTTTSALESEFQDLQAQLAKLERSSQHGEPQYTQLQTAQQQQQNTGSGGVQPNLQPPYINYPQDDMSKSKSWIEVPKPRTNHNNNGGLHVGSEGSSVLHVGSDGSTICVGSSGSTASLDEQYFPGSGSSDPQKPQAVRRRRGGRGGGQPPDGTYKLERSRQSARECRARKKLRYQYLDDIILERERANMVLKQELEKYVSWCTELDRGRLPNGWDEFIKASEVKQEINTEEY